MCTGASVVVVGGGNSAGQAAIYLAQQGSARDASAIRGDDLGKSMSRYLIERIDADPRIEVLTHDRGPCARGRRAPRARSASSSTPTGERRTIACAGLFCFIGADPATEWLGGRWRSTPVGSC